jgi:hypothetical protein
VSSELLPSQPRVCKQVILCSPCQPHSSWWAWIVAFSGDDVLKPTHWWEFPGFNIAALAHAHRH